jgi:hypothetical protein
MNKNFRNISLLVLVIPIFSLQSSYAALVFEKSAPEEVVPSSELEEASSLQKVQDNETYEMETLKTSNEENIFTENMKDISVKDDVKEKYENFGYTAPGMFEKSENYLEDDTLVMAKELRTNSSGSINIAFIKDSFNYQSENDVINKTISEGYRHVKGGTLHLRSDQYYNRTKLLNTFWSVGAGVGYNAGRGIFVDGERSNTTFKLWEVPVDLSLGLEIPMTPLVKLSGSAGPSLMGLFQNRNDLQSGEKGRNKIQVSYGEFANAQFKVSLSGFSNDMAYNLFTESRITNLFLNLEARYENYQNFQDDIKISGASFGVGFTFEYL